MNKSCLDCKYVNFSLIIGKAGRCEWKLPSDSPTWLLEYPLRGTGANRIPKNRPYVDCPAWKGK